MRKELCFNKELGIKLRMARKKAKVTQQRMANFLDLDQSAVSRIENGTQSLTVFQFIKIAKFLSIPLRRLIK